MVLTMNAVGISISFSWPLFGSVSELFHTHCSHVSMQLSYLIFRYVIINGCFTGNSPEKKRGCE